MSECSWTSTVHISGVVLAALQYEMLNASPMPFSGDVEGLLLGQVQNVYRSVVTDATMDASNYETQITICSFVTINPFIQRFYGPNGQVDLAFIEELLETRKESIIGFFRCRRNSKHSVSVRERAIYESLQQARFSYHNQSNVSNQIFALLTNTVLDSGVQNIDFTCYTKSSSKPSGPFEKIPSKILNMVESSDQRYRECLSALPGYGSSLEERSYNELKQQSQESIGIYRKVVETEFKDLQRLNATLAESEQQLIDAWKSMSVKPPTPPRDTPSSRQLPLALSPTPDSVSASRARIPERSASVGALEKEKTEEDLLDKLD
ncbi:uncharacterized protein BJ171DRAFT_515586 [Polychytrium aggregatum]|uniref:uncharacterized protein n=1 Tax=Polychytrium aggregatum TaxID=110093 RepID=UPI0022FF196D|nr:uncharacterized protein BJ171DRAFT_515586 [Polychytrium aggregatum]KAI9202060.1 hypothetical protein BJ171DRAFT_515586 [Polychytrium aggregatum]